MAIHEQHLEDLKQIRSLMERSSRFISLSGLSGVFAGLYALTGAAAVWIHTNNNPVLKGIVNTNFLNPYTNRHTTQDKLNFMVFLFIDAAIVFVLAVSTGIYMTTRQAKKKGQSIWDISSQKMIINLCIPLVTGGLFSFAMIYHSFIGFVAPAMLLFYGLALINASKYTLTDIRYLGFCEIALGLIAMFNIGYGLFFWSIGFGVLHIIYGTVMYFKYER